MDIVIDFDGTCVTHAFPAVGLDIGAEPILKKILDNGHNLILFTMRSDLPSPTYRNQGKMLPPGNYLKDAIDWFDESISGRPFVDWEAVNDMMEYMGFFRNKSEDNE